VTSYEVISLDHLAEHMIHLLSAASSFWFSPNSSYDSEFLLSKRLGTSRSAGCRIASLRPLIVPPSCPAPSITLALALAPSIACRRRAVPRHHSCRQAAAAVPLSSCRHHRCRRHCAAVRWLVVALLTAVRFRHHMLSYDRQRSRCRPLSSIFVFHRCHRRHRRHHRCRQAATTATATATTVVKLTIVH
jgi:hypothetical protein